MTNPWNLVERQENLERRTLQRIEELWVLLGNNISTIDNDSVIFQIARLVIPDAMRRQIYNNRTFKERTLQAKKGEYTYKVFFREYHIPYKIDRTSQ